MTAGTRAGESFVLVPGIENLIGRGIECQIVLADPICSRVHAVLQHEDGRWVVRDRSRNGTFVNDQKIDEAVIAEGHVLRVGSTEFAFHQSEMAPTTCERFDVGMTQTVVRDARVDAHEAAGRVLAAIRDSEQAQDLLLLHQLSIKMLGLADANDVVRHALELVRERSGASLAGFLWLADDGRLKTKLVVPQRAADQVVLSESLTHLVTREGRAVWVANQHAASNTESLQHYADALCVPLVHRGIVLGAIHLYLERGRFRESHFEFAISAANIASVALARARHEQSLQSDLQRLKDKAGEFDELLGESKPMLDLKAKIQRVAKAGGCVLIRGESGSGKELVARAIHRASPRADRPLLSVNCAALPENLMESHLFGHKAGAFTGADRDHVGFFQQADLGTLFLDEIGELTLAGQSKLLRILEGHPFLPVGAAEEISVDVRVIAATNQNLQSYVREKRFREDLYYRLSVFELYIPPLRERGPDIERLIDHFLELFRRQHGRPNLTLAAAARTRLLSYHWPGNVRQLRNVIDSAVVLASGDEIQTDDLSLTDSGAAEVATLRLDHWERKLIQEALARTKGNVPEAAKLLGIGRATLYRKIDEFRLSRAD
jgi:Nif-specific regulatory protein